MYIHLGGDYFVEEEKIIGIFDFENNRYDTGCNIGNTDIAGLHCVFCACALSDSGTDRRWYQGAVF